METRTAKTTVGLVQIGEMSWTRRPRKQWRMHNGQLIEKPQGNPPSSFVYLPYSVGLLQGYAQHRATNPHAFAFLPFLYYPLPVAEAVEQLKGADVVAFSAYVWNIRLSLAIAAALKAANPNVTIIFGGPQVPDRAEPLAAFLHQNPAIDVVCHGEGEQIFLALLERIAAGSRLWEEIPSISYRAPDGTVRTHPRAPRLVDFAEIPSPFLTGVFDATMAANSKHRWLVMWETNRGCPFSCTFCDWGSATASKVSRLPMERLSEEIRWFADHRIEHLFICDANFGMLPRDADIAREIVDVNKARGIPIAVSVQNTKNAKERSYQVQKIFSEITTAGVTISLQSVNPDVLKNVKRDNISLDAFLDLQQRYARDGIRTYTDLILGLPGETYDSFTDGLSTVIKHGQHNRLAIYNCSILPNAEMGDPDYQAHFGMKAKPIRIINEHELLSTTDRIEVPEYLDNVVETAAMAGEDWIRAKAYTWLADLMHYNRIFQLVSVVMVEHYGLSYKQIFEAVLYADEAKYPICGWVRERLYAQARINQSGQSEYVPDPERLNAWWLMHQHLFILLVEQEKLTPFYHEVERLLGELLTAQGVAWDFMLLHEAISLNQALIRLPFIQSDEMVFATHNLYEYYKGVIEGYPIPLKRVMQRYHIDRTSTVWTSWEEWYEDIVLRIYRREDYLYEVRNARRPARPVAAGPVAGHPARPDAVVSAD